MSRTPSQLKLSDKMWAMRFGTPGSEAAYQSFADREYRPSELKCEEQLATLDGGSARCSALTLHPSLPLLVSATAREEVSVWDYRSKQRLNAFANSNPAGSRCTSMMLLESYNSNSLLLVGSSEGCVRVWRRWASAGEQQLIGSFLAADRVGDVQRGGAAALTASRDSPIAFGWQPSTSTLPVACGSERVRLWDLASERCFLQIAVGSANPSTHDPPCIKSLSADPHSPLMLVGGSDGVARALDPRVSMSTAGGCVVATLGPFQSGAPISHLSMQLADGSPWVAAATPQGDIAVWDWRRAVTAQHAVVGNAQPPAASGSSGGVHPITSHRALLSALTLHPHLPRVASGSRNQFIKLFDIQALREGGAAKEVHSIRYFDGFLGARIGPVTCLAFHPTRMLLAVGATDSVLSIYGTA